MIMRHREISNADIARYMCVNERTVVKWFGNPFALTLRQLTQLAGLFNCSVQFLVYSLSANNCHESNEQKAANFIEHDKIRFNV